MGSDIKLVIFDCDGVLVDSEGPANRTFRDALADHGLELNVETVVRLLKGLSLSSCRDVIEERYGLRLPPDFFDRLQTETYDRFKTELRPVRGIEQALRSLTLPFCVASSGSFEKMNFTLGLTGLLPLVSDRLFSASQVARGKPHPDLFLHAADRMGFDPADCLVIEDSRPGVEAAHAAGMQVFGFAGTDCADAQELAAAGASVFDHMSELNAMIQHAPVGRSVK